MSDTWHDMTCPINKEHEVKLDKTRASRLRWMCGLRRKKGEMQRSGNYWDWNTVSLVIKKDRLRWF